MLASTQAWFKEGMYACVFADLELWSAGDRRLRGAAGDIQQGCPAGTAEELSNLSPAWRSGAHVLPHVSGRASVGESHQNRGALAQDAAMVCRCKIRPFPERETAQRCRDPDAGELGRQRRC